MRRVALVLLACAALGCRRPAAARVDRVPPFASVDQDGRRLTDRDLVGHIWIADFIFTRCTTVCPLLSARMIQLQRRLGDPALRFVSFSVDPEHDTPAVLRAYAARWPGDHARWRLAHSDERTVRALAAGLRAVVQRTDDPDAPVVHSSRFSLVDGDGRLRGSYASDDDREMARLIADAATLTRAAAPTPAATPSGAALFAALGCAGCHDHPDVAGPLAGLFGRTVELDDGRRVVADEAYLRESIVDPAAKIVAGYSVVMPSYAGQLSAAELTTLVDYLEQLRRPIGQSSQ